MLSFNIRRSFRRNCNKEFDFIVCNGVLHEISDPNYFLSSIGKL